LHNIVILFIIIMFLTVSVGAGEGEINISFSNVDLADALRALADIAGVNLLICSRLEGTVSAHLEGISFSEAWSGLILSQGLDFIKTDNTYLVGSRELIAELRSQEKIVVLQTDNVPPDKIITWAEVIFPGVRMASDGFSNSLVCSGPEEEIVYLQKVINRMDQPGEGELSRIIRLEHLLPEEGAEIVATFHPDLLVKEDCRRSILILRGPRASLDEARSLLAHMDQAYPEEKIRMKRLAYGDPDYTGELLRELFPQAGILVDHRLNKLILRGDPETLIEIQEILPRMDQPRPLIMVEFRLEEISSKFLKNQGLNWDWGPEINFFDKDFLSGEQPLTFNLDYLLQLLEEKGVSETIARPRLTTLDGVEGQMIIGDRIPIRGARIDNGEEQVSYFQTGIIISFTPRVGADDYITLKVQPQVSTIGEDLDKGFPQVRTREAQTIVRVKCGDTFAVGGLIQQQDRRSDAAIPWLSDLPLIGSWFSSKEEDQQSTELIIFITPHIIGDGEEKPDL